MDANEQAPSLTCDHCGEHFSTEYLAMHHLHEQCVENRVRWLLLAMDDLTRRVRYLESTRDDGK